ncbi:MAG: hypothetical protein Q9173_005426, partial [Seirophora scorigena]
MPSARRGRPPGSTSSNSTNNNLRAAQSTLAFGRSNKITKPSIPAPASKKAVKPNAQQEEQRGQQVKDITHLVDEEQSTHEEDVVGSKAEVVNEDPTLAEGRREAAARAAARQAREEQEDDDDAEGKARKVSEAAVKRYWRAKEGERKAPR